MTPDPTPTDRPNPDLPDPTTEAGRAEIVRRARAGDRAMAPLLHRLLRNPSNVRHLGGDLAAAVEAAFITALHPTDLAAAHATAAGLEALRAGLLGPAPAPLERLLVARVVACWLQVQDAEYRAGASPETAREYVLRRMESAQRRHLAAIAALTAFRKAAAPALSAAADG